MDTVESLGKVWRAWAELGSSLTDRMWTVPTRLPGWTVADVYAHHSVFPMAMARAAAEPVDALPTHPGAGALLAMFNADADAHRTVSDAVRMHAVDRARRLSPADMVDQFRVTAPQAMDAIRTVGLDRVVNYSGVAVLPLGEALRIALMESVVHYLDIARALDLPAPGPVEGAPLRATAALLAEVADPVDFVEQATGRAPVTVLPVIR